MEWKFTDDRPIWQQLSQQIARQILIGVYPPGSKLPPVRELAAQAGVLSIVPEHMDAEALGAALADRGIAVRAGLHCAPLAHRTAGTLDTGTVRLSFSHWNTREEVSRFLVAMGEILR